MAAEHSPTIVLPGDILFTLLGTGTSVGVPVIGCDCSVCKSPDPRNKRTRSSLLVETSDFSLLIDSGPDLREQALRENIRKVDAVLYTHEHIDHVVGFDELRAFCWKRHDPLPLYATPATMKTLHQMFGWAFQPENQYTGYIRPEARIIDGPIQFGALTVTPLPVEHASVVTIGFKFQIHDGPALAYIPDVKRIPDSTIELMRNIDAILIDGLRPIEHPTHMSTHEAVEMIQEIHAKEAWLTHLTHDNEYQTLEDALPPHIHAAYDGMRLHSRDLRKRSL